MKFKTTLLAFILALFTFNIQSQSFTKSQVYDSLRLTGQFNQVTLFDYDEDGDDDIFCYGSTNDSRVLVFYNDNGSFDSSFVFYSAISTSKIVDITILDYDLDSDLDLIAYNANSGDILKFENNNSGNFSLTTQTNIIPGADEYLDNADMDNDGNTDLVYMSFSPRQIRWVKNLGAGTFSTNFDTVAIVTDRIRSFELADLDNDGDMDVITQYQAATGTASAMSINDGVGNFTTNLNFPIPYSSNNYSYTLGDFNNDSLVDVAYVTNSNSLTQQLIVLWNDSGNTFNTNSILATSTNPFRLKTVEKFDFDGDNDLDLLVGQSDLVNSKADGIVLKNQGNKNFATHSEKIEAAIWGVGYNGFNYRGIEMFFSDFDVDGNMDILSNSYADEDLMVHFQQNDSSFLSPSYLNHSFKTIINFQLLDYNNDGKIDLATVDERTNGKLEMAYGDGSKGFDSSEVIADNKTAFGAIGTQLAFWNNNTDYDLILSSTNQVYVHLDYDTPNDSIILLFTSNPSSTIGNIGYPNITNKVFTVADVDNDGDNDLIIPQQGSSNPYYWIENTGGFTSVARSISAINYSRYLLTDVDGDLDLDFVGQRFNSSTNLTEYVFFKMNPVTKAYTSYLTLSAPNLGSYEFAAGDIDNDGDNDIVISGLSWMENDSVGNFLAPVTLVSGYTTLSNIKIDDIDNDGFLDIITNVTRQGPTRQLIVPLFNQDSNIFIPLAQELQVSITNQHAIGVGDFNGNGFKSIVVGDNINTGATPVIFDFCINTNDTVNVAVCSGDSYTFPDATIQTNITTATTQTSTLLAANGCDSIIFTSISVNPVINNSISQNGFTLTANQANASYQWMTCSGGIFTPINGATSQSYTTTTNGDFSVEITLNGCVDSSNCLNVVGVGINALSASNEEILIYPNPNNGNFNVKISENSDFETIVIRDYSGKIVYQQNIINDRIIINTDLDKGFYFIELSSNHSRVINKVIIL